MLGTIDRCGLGNGFPQAKSGGCIVIAVCLGLLGLSTAAANELRWKFKSGESYLAKIEQKSEVTSTVAGTPTVMTLETGLELAWQVKAVDEQGIATIGQKFQRLTMKLQTPKAGAISYNSASQAKPTGDAKVIAAAVQPLLEAELTLTLTPRGEIKSVELDEAAQQVVAGLPANNALKTLLSTEGQANVLRQTVVVLPEDDVAPGYEWQRSADLVTPLGKLNQSTNYKLLEPAAQSPDVARIESLSQLELEGVPDAKPRATTLKDQQQRGLILFDRASGRLKSAEISQELTTTSMLKDTPLQVKLVSNLKMTLEPKE